MQNRLSGWKRQTLSLAGRLTLANSVTNQMGVFHMQHSHIPTGVRQQMERIQRDFIWNKEDGKRKIHAVGWETLCTSKERGGYGMKDAGIMNDALLGKIGWNIIAKPRSLCSQVLRGKYERDADLKEYCITKKADSEIWRNLARIWPQLVNNVHWEVGNGEKVKFWKDKWLEDGVKLVEKSMGRISEEEMNCAVRDMVKSNGEWDLQHLSGLIPDEAKRLILPVPPPKEEFGEDEIKWGTSLKNQYVVADMYKLMKDEQGSVDPFWKKLWEWKGPRRIQVFMWLAAQNRLLTAERRSRFIGGSGNCYKCNGEVEDLMHVLRDCPAARGVWEQLAGPATDSVFYQSRGIEWFKLNLCNRQQMGDFFLE